MPEPEPKKNPTEFEVDLAGKKTSEQIRFATNEILMKEPQGYMLFAVNKEGKFEYIADLSGLEGLFRQRFRYYGRKILKKHILATQPEIKEDPLG